MHAAYAARIRNQPQGRGQDARLAHHSLESKDFVTALAALLRAVDEAENLGAPGAALRHVEQALSIWDAVPEQNRPEDVDEIKLLHEASYFASTSGEPERAVAYSRSATEALTPDTELERAARVWRRHAEALLSLDGTIDEVVEAISKAWELVEHTEASPVRAWVLSTRAGILRLIDRREEALSSALAAVADAQAVGAGGAEAAALVSLGTLADSAGDLEEARERLRQAEHKARDSGAFNGELRALHFLGLSYDDQAEIQPALKYYAKGVRRAEENGLTWSSFGIELRAKQLTLRYVSGDWPDEDAGRAGRGVSSLVAARFLGIWALFVVARGRFEDADKIIPGLRQYWGGDVQVALVGGDAGIQLANWRREYAPGVQQAQELIAWLEEIEPSILGGIRISAHGIAAAVGQAAEARVRGDQATVAAAVAAGEELLAHGRRCAEYGTPRSVSLGPEALAWLARMEALGSCLRGPGDPALWAKAVEAFGYGAVYEQAICRRYHAEALLASDGDTELAAAELVAALAVAERLGAAPLRAALLDLGHRARLELPGAAPRREVVDPLTDRERDVLERVALGRTNRQVGEELYISEKTVSVHLSRVMAKLGASRRAEAVAIAYDRGLLAAPTTSS